MDFPTIDLNRNPPHPRLSIAKPNKAVIGVLKEAYDIIFNPKLGGVNQLSFKIPVELDLNNQLVTNPNIDKIKFRYLIKFEISDLNYTEWFIVINPQEKAEEDAIYKEYICYSLAHELSNKIIRSYSGESLNATEVLTEVVVANSTWTLDYIDATFDLRYRQFDVSQSSILDFLLNNVSEAFNALIIFNTVTRKISLYQPQNYGLDKGLTLNYGQYLKDVSTQLDHTNFCTRLRPFGREGIGIQRLTPTGSNYVENFDIFMDGFEQDEYGNVLSSALYFSDNLAKAQTLYEELLEIKQGEFDALLASKTSLQSDLATKTSEWNDLYTELLVILDSIDVKQANGEDVSALIIQRDAKQAEIDVVEGEIDTINSQIDDIDDDIAILNDAVSLENNFTAAEILERDTFIIEKIYENQHIYDDEDLYELAIEKLDELKSPPIVVDIDIIDFTKIVECQLDWDKLNLQLGDIVRVRHPKLNLLIEAKVIEATINYETEEINLIIANIKDLTDQDKILSELNKSFHSSTTVNMSRVRWDGIEDVENSVQSILNETWEAANIPLSAAVEGSLMVDGRGLTSINHAPPIVPTTKGLRILHGSLITTSDGFNTASVAVTGDGVYAQRLIGQIIASINLTITNTAGNFFVDKDGVTIEDMDLTITRTGNTSRILANATDGFKIQKYVTDSWVDKLYADVDGNLILAGELNAATGTFAGLVRGGSIKIGGTLEEPVFEVDEDGNVYATSGTFGGLVRGGSIKIGGTLESPVFEVDTLGNLYALSGEFSGSLDIGNGSFVVDVDGNLWAGYSEYGYFHVPHDADGVFNKFRNPLHDYDAARWKYDNSNYIFQNEDYFTVFFSGLGKFRLYANGDARVYNNLYVDGNIFWGEGEDTGELPPGGAPGGTTIDEFLEYGIFEYDDEGVQLDFVQEYTEEPLIHITLQADSLPVALDTSTFIMAAEHVIDNDNYVGVKAIPVGTSVPATLTGTKVAISAVCKGVAS
ncbi:MAG: phage tail protein [Candidatus Aenigmarchaeota archaeon]|nr:phage tail protein [Candidatus Aenigmarchaeota archaeon]